MADPEYVAMNVHVELETVMAEIPKECELANMKGNWNDLSTVTINGGKTLILKHNFKLWFPNLNELIY